VPWQVRVTIALRTGSLFDASMTLPEITPRPGVCAKIVVERGTVDSANTPEYNCQQVHTYDSHPAPNPNYETNPTAPRRARPSFQALRHFGKKFV
jgi:hypothetical protein